MNLIQRLFAAFFPKKPDAKPVKFPEVNFTYTTPAHMTKEQCGDLPCFRSDNNAISCWKFPFRDRFLFLLTGRMWLYVLMNGHPPVCLMTETPFPKPAKPPLSKTWKLVIAGAILLVVLLILTSTKIKISVG